LQEWLDKLGRYGPKVILLAVGWYLRFSLSRIATLRNLGEEACAPITSRCGDGLCPGNGTTFASETQTYQQ
jgi:hypothetical protein